MEWREREGEKVVSSRMKILVVDDDVGIRETLSDILELKGYEAITANDGYQAVERVKEDDYDFVLTDIKMPGLNGAEAYKIMRTEKPDLKVALMTAYTVEDVLEETLKDNSVVIFSKPLDIEEVMKLLDDVT